MFENVEPYLKEHYNVEKKYIPENKYLSLAKFFKNVTYTLKVKADIIHVTGENYFCACFTPRKKTVLTIHDYVALKDLKGIGYFLDWLLMYYIPIKRSAYITCNSYKTYCDTIEKFPWCKEKTYVIPVSINDNFTETKKEFNKEKPVILVIGSTPNKNITRIIQALEGITCKLDLVGKLTDEQIKLLTEKRIDYNNVTGISNEEILCHYRNCDIVCFPSTYEGFGMPVVEGQAMGRVVLTSDMEPMKSVSGGAACLVDPYSIDSIRNGIIKIISDNDYRKGLIRDGLVNCQKYRNLVTAEKYMEIYQKIEDKNKKFTEVG